MFCTFPLLPTVQVMEPEACCFGCDMKDSKISFSGGCASGISTLCLVCASALVV